MAIMRQSTWIGWIAIPVAAVLGWATGLAARGLVSMGGTIDPGFEVKLPVEGAHPVILSGGAEKHARTIMTNPEVHERVLVRGSATNQRVGETATEIEHLSRYVERLRAFSRVNRFKVEAGLTERELRTHLERSLLVRGREELESLLQTMTAPAVMDLWEVEQRLLLDLRRSIVAEDGTTQGATQFELTWAKGLHELEVALVERNAPNALLRTLRIMDAQFVLARLRSQFDPLIQPR